MIFVWGKKPVYRPAGFVADYCPVCRAAKAFSVQRIGTAQHLYYITVTEGELAGYQRSCCECKLTLPANTAGYARLSETLLPFDQLLQKTNPHLMFRIADKLAAQADLPALDDAGRAREIDAAFHLLADKVDEFYASTQLDKEVWWSIGAAFAFCTLVLTALKQQAPENLDKGFIIAFFLSLGAVAWQLSQTSERFLQREVLPTLARALKPLQPREAELDGALERLRGHGRRLGNKITAAQLRALLGS